MLRRGAPESRCVLHQSLWGRTDSCWRSECCAAGPAKPRQRNAKATMSTLTNVATAAVSLPRGKMGKGCHEDAHSCTTVAGCLPRGRK
jgi:hypothetical protein